MKKILFLAAIIVLVLVLFCACSNTLQATLTEAENPNYLYIRVESNPDEGTSWEYEIVDEDLIKYVDVIEEENLNTDVTGDNLAQAFVFEAVKDGKGTIIMNKISTDSGEPVIIQKYIYDINNEVPVLVNIENVK